MSSILAIGPRELPANGVVTVWLDAGSGSSGQRITVSVKDLQVAKLDSGHGMSAIYELSTPQRATGQQRQSP